MSEDRISDIEKKINRLEYDEIRPLKESVNEIKIQLGQNNLLTKQATETNAKLTETLMVVKESLIELATSVKASNQDTKELASNVSVLSGRVATLDNKVDVKFNEVSRKVQEVDDKSKIDITRIQADKLNKDISKYLIGGGIIGTIVLVMELITKFI